MMRTRSTRGGLALAALVCTIGMTPPARADVVMLQASKDTSLFETTAGTTSAGGADGIYVGRTGQSDGTAVRRGLVAFDLAEIPQGSTINSVSLRMFVAIASPVTPTTNIAVYRVLGDWGEGTAITTSGNSGAPAQAGDATWLHQFFPNDQWITVGGDFVATSSAEQIVGGTGTTVTWTSTPPLVEDVQGWVDNPASNFGWMLRGNESLSRTARKFASSEFGTPNSRPLLTVDFTPPSMRTPGDVNDDGDVNAADLALFVASYGATTTANNFDVGEFSGDGIVGLADLAIIQRNLSGGGLAASPAAVPEPSALVLCAAAEAVLAFRRTRGRRFGLGTFADVRRD